MGKMSKTKGKVGEREVAAFLRAYGFADAKRGQQFAGGGDSPDVAGLPGFHIEVKRCETFSLYAALEQAVGDADPRKIPIVFHRRNTKPWTVILRADDFLYLLNGETSL